MKDFFNNLNKNSNESIAIGILGSIIVLSLLIPALRPACHHEDVILNGPSVTAPAPVEPGVPTDIGGINQSMDEEAKISATVAADLIGLNEDDATAWAEENGRTLRVGSRDGEYFALTMDYRPNRITVDIVDGIVTNTMVG